MERPEPRLEAPHRFAPLVASDRGRVSEADGNGLMADGFADKNALRIILGVATKRMSNYMNHSARSTLDPFMRGNEWATPLRPTA